MVTYDDSYYQNNLQNHDRIGVVWYARKINMFIESGPILDFGAGTGHLVKRLIEPNFAIETNKFAISRIEENSPRTKIINNIESLSDNSLKGIVLLHVVEHIYDEELVRLFEMFYKKLTINGKIFVATPSLGGLANNLKKHKWNAFKDLTHINLKSSKEWRDFFTSRNFQIIRTYGDGFYDFPYSNNIHLNLRLILKSLINLLAKNSLFNEFQTENVVFELKKISLGDSNYDSNSLIS